MADLSLGNDAEFEPGFADAFSQVFGFQESIFSASPNADFGVNEGFNVIAFSQGHLAGTGSFSVTSVGGVPEPAAWAMMIAGFGLTGAAMPRRNSRSALPA